MVTYKDVYDAFCTYAASRSQGDWNRLWFLCEERMSALVKTKARGLTVPLDSMDLMDLIRDSTARVLRRLKEATDVTEDYISVTFFDENRHAFTAFCRKEKKWGKMKRSASLLNSSAHNDPPETREEIERFWGGRHKISEAQKVARRENGKKGGRPKKMQNVNEFS